MRCRSWRTVSGTALALLIGALAVAPAGAAHVTAIDDAVVGEALLGHFDYVGDWQHVRGKHDGRTNGTSTRSTHTSDVAIFRFMGTRVRIYGVLGPSGGRAGVALDDRSTTVGPVDFYAPHVRGHALIYQSPVLPYGVHNVSIVVWGTRNARGRYYYVNIDGAEVES